MPVEENTVYIFNLLNNTVSECTKAATPVEYAEMLMTSTRKIVALIETGEPVKLLEAQNKKGGKAK